ncbi:hypothetical protein BO86DRAFT_45332 [Aspergillus japonicus CBS 114.51]|uniref:Uncharacterized protein n=1 Tax=Aspergillus japonicus CBS 114.51 TaxID=1448312 RepID=A0A8T8WJF9_ASPJA|nr:hypothetical protein BO86DRAFT_45332 [Aspergillus japonicus CBS 114.51]RAH75877.1 hypothetical protein BO86DRAFT_45332 [Aspergillus japonicus CBS 114.51]
MAHGYSDSQTLSAVVWSSVCRSPPNYPKSRLIGPPGWKLQIHQRHWAWSIPARICCSKIAAFSCVLLAAMSTSFFLSFRTQEWTNALGSIRNNH